MTAINDHTGAFIRTKANTIDYDNGYDAIDWGARTREAKEEHGKELLEISHNEESRQ